MCQCCICEWQGVGQGRRQFLNGLILQSSGSSCRSSPLPRLETFQSFGQGLFGQEQQGRCRLQQRFQVTMVMLLSNQLQFPLERLDGLTQDARSLQQDSLCDPSTTFLPQDVCFGLEISCPMKFEQLGGLANHALSDSLPDLTRMGRCGCRIRWHGTIVVKRIVLVLVLHGNDTNQSFRHGSNMSLQGSSPNGWMGHGHG